MSRETLHFITSNKDKLAEMIMLLGKKFPYQLISKRVDLNEYQGDEDFIVKKKCLEAAKMIGGPVIVEDTSLGFDAFGGLPGPYIKYFLDSIGPSGLYRMLKDWDNKRAIASCRIGFCESPSIEPIVFKGEIAGTIVEPRGSTGFGFDYCFQPEGFSVTFAEMEKETKNELSHRFLAVKEMSKHFEKPWTKPAQPIDYSKSDQVKA